MWSSNIAFGSSQSRSPYHCHWFVLSVRSLSFGSFSPELIRFDVPISRIDFVFIGLSVLGALQIVHSLSG